jgi:hypothetical protein
MYGVSAISNAVRSRGLLGMADISLNAETGRDQRYLCVSFGAWFALGAEATSRSGLRPFFHLLEPLVFRRILEGAKFEQGERVFGIW